MSKKENLVGRRFGRWTVLKEGKEKYKVLCRCDCGTVCEVNKYMLLENKSQSCGCLQKEKVSKAMYKHGFYQERLYSVWAGMKQRCNNPNHVAYHNYGGKGIRVCDEWSESYPAFREFMLSHGYDPDAPFGECTIDRIDGNGNYCPENCRVVPIREQNVNKCDVFSFILDGKRTTISGAARSRNRTRSCLQYRLSHGWTLEDAIEKPLQEVQKFEANGEWHTVSEWANILNVTVNVIRGRLQNHTMQDIVDEYNKNGFIKVNDCSPKSHTVDGVTHGQKEWGEILGIPNSSLRYKLKKKTMQEIVDGMRAAGKEVTF